MTKRCNLTLKKTGLRWLYTCRTCVYPTLHESWWELCHACQRNSCDHALVCQSEKDSSPNHTTGSCYLITFWAHDIKIWCITNKIKHKPNDKGALQIPANISRTTTGIPKKSINVAIICIWWNISRTKKSARICCLPVLVPTVQMLD